MKPKILVTSAGGKTGMHVVTQLRQQGIPVRALLRREDDRANVLREKGAEVVICNQYSVDEMRAAMQGIDRAYQCIPTAPNGLYFCNVFAAAAKGSNLKHVVMLSQWLACENHPSLFTREVWLGEQLLKQLDASHTIIDVGWFADNYFMVLEPAVQLGLLPMPLGSGHIKTDVPPSTRDIAAVVVGALLNPSIHASKRYRPTGPALVSPDDVATAIGNAAGVSVKYDNISEAMFLKALFALKPPMFSEAAVTQLKLYVEEYRSGTFAIGGPTNVVERVGGKKPDSIDEIAEDMVATRPEAKRNFANKLIALKNFAKIVLTPKPDIPHLVKILNQVQIQDGEFAIDNRTWLSLHRNS